MKKTVIILLVFFVQLLSAQNVSGMDLQGSTDGYLPSVIEKLENTIVSKTKIKLYFNEQRQQLMSQYRIEYNGDIITLNVVKEQVNFLNEKGENKTIDVARNYEYTFRCTGYSLIEYP